MKKDAQKYVKSCMMCAETKPDLRGIYRIELHVTAKRPLNLISLDINGKLPRSQGYLIFCQL